MFSILFFLYVLQVGSLIIWFTDTGQSLSAEVWFVQYIISLMYNLVLQILFARFRSLLMFSDRISLGGNAIISLQMCGRSNAVGLTSIEGSFFVVCILGC